MDIYSRSLLKLPTPRYIVLYNGTEKEEERIQLRLSSAYEKQETEEPCLECVATVLNVNRGHNKELMEKCRKLYEYAYLVGKIRDFLAMGKTLESAVELAVEACLENGILLEYLRKHRAEVKFMILSEYNEELHLKDTYEVGKAEGRAEGREEGREEGKAEGEKRVNALIEILIRHNRLEDLKRAAVDGAFQKQLFEEFDL